MRRLAVKTLRGTKIVEAPPNGGWAWVVMLASFVVNGISWGITKTLGVYFVEIKNEFEVTNTAVSWLINILLSLAMLSGLLANLSLKWFDAREVVMGGGLLAGIGMVIMSVSAHFAPLYLGAVLAGLGFGLSAITAILQISLYFSTWRPLANGVVITGSTIFGAIFPYSNQYLLNKYGWRGAFLILGALSLNISAFGSLIRPIRAVSDKSHAETKDSIYDGNRKRKRTHSLMTLTKRYWIAAGFLLVDFLFSMAMYAPNVFMVPYAKEIGLKVSEGILILAFISPGGFVGSVGFGLATSKVKFFKQSMIFIMAACALVLSILQIIPLFFESLYSLLAYSTLYGFAMNATVTLSLSTVGQLLTSESVEKGIAILVACDGIALLVSGPAIGALVDGFGQYIVAFWYTLFLMLMSGSLCLPLSLAVKRRGSLFPEI